MLMKILKWGGLAILVGYVALVIYRGFVLNGQDKTNEQVAKIHSTKLSLDDVLGKNLPSPPANPDATIAGVDANTNGIRDDVELAIFAAYPNSARTRAVLLQYALALQMEFVQPILNKDTVIAVVQEGGRAHLCVGAILSRDDMTKYIEQGDTLRSFVETRQVNTKERREREKDFYDKLGSYESLDRVCDINYSALPN